MLFSFVDNPGLVGGTSFCFFFYLFFSFSTWFFSFKKSKYSVLHFEEIIFKFCLPGGRFRIVFINEPVNEWSLLQSAWFVLKVVGKYEHRNRKILFFAKSWKSWSDFFFLEKIKNSKFLTISIEIWKKSKV